jgi:hypothetical protein
VFVSTHSVYPETLLNPYRARRGHPRAQHPSPCRRGHALARPPASANTVRSRCAAGLHLPMGTNGRSAAPRCRPPRCSGTAATPPHTCRTPLMPALGSQQPSPLPRPHPESARPPPGRAGPAAPAHSPRRSASPARSPRDPRRAQDGGCGQAWLNLRLSLRPSAPPWSAGQARGHAVMTTGGAAGC